MSDYKRIFEAITSDPRYQRNLEWGKPRPGHPEGSVRAHIAEVDQNLETMCEKVSVSEIDYWRIKLLVHTHDTFKGEAERGVSIAAPTSHASLARNFLAEFCDDTDLLAMVQFHDEPYALWRQVQAHGEFNQERMNALFTNIRDWDLFIAFAIIDGSTEGKSRDPLRWFLQQVIGRKYSRFTESDIL